MKTKDCSKCGREIDYRIMSGLCRECRERLGLSFRSTNGPKKFPKPCDIIGCDSSIRAPWPNGPEDGYFALLHDVVELNRWSK